MLQFYFKNFNSIIHTLSCFRQHRISHWVQEDSGHSSFGDICLQKYCADILCVHSTVKLHIPCEENQRMFVCECVFAVVAAILIVWG